MIFQRKLGHRAKKEVIGRFTQQFHTVETSQRHFKTGVVLSNCFTASRATQNSFAGHVFAPLP